MVYLQSISSLLAAAATAGKKEKKNESSALENSLPKRRKYQDYDGEEENEDDDDEHFFSTKMPRVGAGADIEIGLEGAGEDPLPLEWQQCLDIKSGEIHFHNTRTNKRTFQDPRGVPAGGAPRLSLDLKLNLAADDAPATGSRLQRRLQPADGRDEYGEVKVRSDEYESCFSRNSRRGSGSWIAVDADQVEEMVAAVCARCHTLVMMCKATPSCPNCKFMHPPPPSPRPIHNYSV